MITIDLKNIFHKANHRIDGFNNITKFDDNTFFIYYSGWNNESQYIEEGSIETNREEIQDLINQLQELLT
jgi:hypothetical protein